MFEYKLDFYQNILTLVILILSSLIVFLFASKDRKDVLKVFMLFIWHTTFSFVYYIFSLSTVSDAKTYYLNSISMDSFRFYPGTPFLSLFASYFSSGFFNLNYFNTTLIFNLIGSIGLVLLYLSIKNYLKKLPWYWIFILFIPSMSFWTGSLGKDSISYFSICLLIFAVTNGKNPAIFVTISFVSMFMVRPHVAALILMSYVIYFIIRANISPLFKIIIIPIIAALLVYSISFVQEYIGLDEASNLNQYIETRQTYGQNTGSYVDIGSMSYPMQIFTYTFRPLPFEAHNFISFINSLENTILLWLFSLLLLNPRMSLKYSIRSENLWLFSYALITCSILAMTTTNLGIATRQKWMFMPVIIYLLVYTTYHLKYEKNKIKSEKYPDYEKLA